MHSHFRSKRLPLTHSLSRFSSAAAVCAALAMAGGASAASYQWDPLLTGTTTGASGGAGVWNVADLSWFNGTADITWPNTTDTAVFAGTGGVVTLGSAVTVNTLQFDKGGYTIDNGGTAANTLTLSGTGAAITVTNATDVATISAVITGSSAWTKAGAGALTLSGANTFTGGLTLNAGTLNINSATALGAATSTFTIAGGTIDNMSGAAITLANNNPQIWSGDFAFTGTNALNLGTGAVALSATRTVAVNASTLTVGGIISGTGFGITKTGAGTLALSGANTFTGRLTINGGTVSATAVNNLGAGPITLDGGTLALGQTAQITLGAAQIITVGASGGTIDNAVPFKLLMNTAGGLTGSGTLTRDASANASSTSNTFQISAANTGFTGAVVLNGGITEVGTNGLGTGATAGNTITVNPGAELAANNTTIANALILNGGIIGGDGGNSTFSGPVTVNASTNVRLGDFYQNTNRNLTITGNLTGTGALTTINNANTATNATGQILTLNPTTGDNSGFTGALNVSGGNNVVFATANALTGGTVVINTNATQIGGVGFNYDFGATVPSFTNTRTGTTGGVFGINTTLASTTSLDMSEIGGGGMYLGSQTSGTYTATTLGADAGVYRLGGGTGTLTLPNATLTGANDLVVGDSRANGNGTVVLGGANTFSGGVSVNNGTVVVGTINSVSGGAAASNLGAPTTVAAGTINLGSSGATGTLRYTGAGETTDRVINLAGTTGGGAIDQSGSGLLKFTSDLTFTGIGNKSLTLQGSYAGVNGEISGKIISNSLTIAKAGTGTWLLSGAGNSVQQLSLSGGVLDIGANGISVSNSGSTLIQATSGNATINATGGGKLIISAASTTDGGNIGAANGATLTINANMETATPGDPFEIYNAANSTGVVVVNGTNNFTGNTFINSGVLQLSNIAGALGSGSVINIGSGSNTTNTLRYTGTGETTSKVINLNASTGAAAIEQAGTGLLKFTGTNTATGVGSKTFTLLGSTTGTGEIAGAIVDNSTNKTSLVKNGTGTWTLSGANSYTGSTTVNGGSLVLNGETGSLNSATTLALNTGGTFSYTGKATGSSQSLGALTVPAGQGTVSSTYGTSGTTKLTLASLARTAGASVNFVSSGGTNGTSNVIAITGQSASGFINQGTYFNGADFAYYNGSGATGFLRAPVYGTDSNFTANSGGTTLGTTTSATHIQLGGNISAQTSASIATLKLNGARTLAIASGATLTASSGGILATGGASTISGGTITSGTAEMSIRTNGASDSLTISSVLAGSGGLTKSGAGTLTLSNSSNTFTGNIFVNGGTLAYVGTNSSADPVALGAGAKTITLTNGAILSPTSTSNPTSGTKSFVVGAGGATFNVANGVTLQLDDAGQFAGTGDLTVTGAGTGTVYLNNQSFNFSGNVFVNSGTLKLGANSGVLGTGTGRTVTIGSGGVVDAQIANLPLGLVLNGTGISSGGALVNTSSTASSFTGPVTINSGATIGGSGAITLSGNITGASLTKVGTNLLTLTGSNTYGNTTITGGGVQFNSLTAFGASGASIAAGTGTTAAAGYAIDQAFLGRISTLTNAFTVGLGSNSSNDLDFNAAGLTNASLGATGAFTYTGTLTPNGTTYRLGGGGGTLTLSNTNALTGTNSLVVNGNTVLASSNDYSGTTTVTAGTLTLTATSNSSAVTINSGATLQLGSGGTTGSIGAATLTNNGTLAYNHGDNVTTDAFTGNGAISQSNGTSTLTINSATTAISRLYVSASGGTIDLGATDRTIGVDGGNSIQMFTSGTGTINATGGAAITLAVAGTDIGAASGGTLVVNPVIQGANGLDIYNSSAGTVVFNGANTYTGGTNIQAGTLSVGSLNSVATDTTLGTVHAASSNLGAPTTAANGTINIGNGSSTTTTAVLKYTGAGETTDRVINLNGSTNGATIDQSGTGLLKFTSNLTATGTGSKTLTLQGSTAGAGEIAGAIVDNSSTNKTSVTKAGTGTWTLSGANTYIGATTVNGGTLALTGTLGSTAITVAAAGTLTQSSTGAIGGTAALTTSGNTTLAGTNTYTGATAVNGGTLALTGTLGSTAITVAAAGTLTQSSTGVIGGTAALTTSGNTTLAGTNTFTGDVSVKAGPLTITNSSALGTGTKTISVIPTSNPSSNPSLRLDGSGGDITLPATMSFTTSFDTIGASGSVLDGAAIINVAGNNTIAGNFNLTSGGGGTTFRSNAGTLTLSGNITPSATARSVYLRGDGNGVISGNIVNGTTTTGLPVTKDVGTGTWTLSGTNTYTGATTVTAGTLALTGTLDSTAITVGAAGTFAQSSTGVIGGAASLTTSGNTTLSGKNTYTGQTNVNAGKLTILASGSIAGSTQVKVDTGATLDVSAFSGGGGFTVGAAQTFIGNGMVEGDLNVGGVVAGSGNVSGNVATLPDGVISPGNGVGTLGIAGNFSLNSAAHLSIELGTAAAAGSDRLSVDSGTVTLGGSLDLTLLPTFADNIGDTFTIILNGGGSAISGFFSNVTSIGATTGLLTFADGHQFLVNYAANGDGGAVANDVALTVAAVPEPSTFVAMLGGAGMLLGMRRRKRTR